jgi:diacylglycerol kinase family enzyme
MSNVWVLHNTRAGQPSYARAVARVGEALLRRGVDAQLRHAADAAALRQAARDALEDGAQMVLVAGGDGSLGLVAGELQGSPAALGCLPAGTGNLWARQLGLPLPSLLRPDALERAALSLLTAPVYLSDLGRCNGAWFLTSAGVGIDSYATQLYERNRAESRRLRGYWYNVALTLRLGLTWRPLGMRLRVSGPDGERELAGRYLMAAVANIGVYAGGVFRFTRRLKLDDGLMDTWLFAGSGPHELFAVALRILLERHEADPRVVRLTGRRVEIYTDQPQVIHIDAEPQPPTRRLSIEVVPRCVRVLAPPAAARELYGGRTASRDDGRRMTNDEGRTAEGSQQ